MCTCLLIFGFETKKVFILTKNSAFFKIKFKLNQNGQSVQNTRPFA